MLIALNHFFQKQETTSMRLINHYYVTIIYATLNVLLFNSMLFLDIGLPKYLLGEFYTF